MEEIEPIPDRIKKLPDRPDILDLLYAYREFTQYVRRRTQHSDNPNSEELKLATINVENAIHDFIKETLWLNFLDEQTKK